ncbi:MULTISPECIES: ExbD/TolR family protein [Vibrio]|uniref:Biopolymer transporter ExbD n=1 Tax=Vibrio casei TaxID=673372 RepID=A0A368LHM5_9VIBR|nr:MULTISPECIES: biopolymer transporter ExbD [Vibrio]RCS70198.1 biopolymer transporter ExbD [Vibrio casei]SJN25711.1 Biopolymer transport protein ExbD1 [Vibrio casei]HBV76037.1 biopolymer transporter ExbD [Vibrio sp.]
MIRSNNPKQINTITPDLTPLLDIIFIVMVFLLLTASVKLSSLEVELPSNNTSQSKSVDAQSITLNILKAAPYWAIDGKPYSTWEQFQDALLTLVTSAPKKNIVIAADKSAEIQHMVKLFTFLQEQKISATQILMEDNL